MHASGGTRSVSTRTCLPAGRLSRSPYKLVVYQRYFHLQHLVVFPPGRGVLSFQTEFFDLPSLAATEFQPAAFTLLHLRGSPPPITPLPRYLSLWYPPQRFCGEAGIKLATVNKVFLTGTGAEEHAGLSGLILTLSALGAPVLEVFGPTGVDKLAVSWPRVWVRSTPCESRGGEEEKQVDGSQTGQYLGDEFCQDLRQRSAIFPASPGPDRTTPRSASRSPLQTLGQETVVEPGRM